ncbi:MAG: cation transporter, partial [Spirochaetota bacterium]
MSTSTTKTRVDIEGMHCASCVASVERSLKKVPGVQVANVNLATESASVEFDAAQASYDDLVAAVDAAGFAVAGRDGAASRPSASSSEIVVEDELAKDERKVRAARRKMWLAWAATIPIIVWMLPEMIAGY